MATDTWSDTCEHIDDASFRALGKKISDSLDLIGLQKTGDTDQIDWDVVTRPGTNAVAGFETRVFDDGVQSTLPVYIKIEYGRLSGNSNATMGFWVTVASETDGAGNMQGTIYVPRYQLPYRNNVGSSGLYPSFFCHKPGYFAMAYARCRNAGQVFFSVFRTCDDSGQINDEGLFVIDGGTGNGNLRRQMWRDGVLENHAQSVCFFPGGGASSAVGDNRQVMRHYAAQPNVRVVPFFVSYFGDEIGNESTFEAITSGVAPRTFLALGDRSSFPGYPLNASLNNTPMHSLAMQYD